MPNEMSHLIPALGESWGHAVTVRIMLQWQTQQRFACLHKSSYQQESSSPFQITVG